MHDITKGHIKARAREWEVVHVPRYGYCMSILFIVSTAAR